MDPHPALPYVAYDEYVLLLDHHGNREVSFEDGISLEEFKDTRQLVVDCSKFTMEGGFVVLPGESDPYFESYEITAEVTKKIARTILKALRTNEQNFVCFTEFDASNVVVCRSGRVKFRNIRILRNLSEGELSQYTRKNYLSAHAIIGDILFSGNPPADIEHLLGLIQNDIFRELYHIHASLVPIATYSALFKEMYDHIRFVIPKEDFRLFLSALPYVETWKSLVDMNALLKVTLNYNVKSYEVPADKKRQTCLSRDQKAALTALGLTQQPGQRSLTQDQIGLIQALHFIEYLRNRTSHRMEPFVQWTAGGNQSYSAQGSELVSHIRFPCILTFMQEQLHLKNRLLELPIDKFF